MSDRKRCTQCHTYKPFDAFSPCRRGLQPACKECRNGIARARPLVTPVAEKTCGTCRQTMSHESFWRSRHSGDGLQHSCKRCSTARRAGVRYEVTLTEKACKDCGLTKPAAEFCVDPKRLGGLRSECRACTSIRTRASVYKLELERVRQMCDRSECDICGETFPSSRHQHIDHCHDTGVVRGVLCGPCNRTLANAKDSSRVLRAAAEYLIRTGTDKPAEEQRRA